MDFEAFYIKNKNFVYNLALQYVQNIEEAQEITQDVFLKAHQKIHTFKGDATLETWLYRITINTSLDAIKAKKEKNALPYLAKTKTSLTITQILIIPVLHLRTKKHYNSFLV